MVATFSERSIRVKWLGGVLLKLTKAIKHCVFITIKFFTTISNFKDFVTVIQNHLYHEEIRILKCLPYFSQMILIYKWWKFRSEICLHYFSFSVISWGVVRTQRVTFVLLFKIHNQGGHLFTFQVLVPYTVWCCYNVNFHPNPHKRSPIARPWGRAMGCILWVQPD